MKKFFASALGSLLIITAMAQERTPPPVPTPPPPAVPSFTPATPQPGVATGASGGIGSRQSDVITGRVPTTGTFATPFPVVMPAGSHPIYPEPYDPLALPMDYELMRALEEPANTGTSQGRPGGGLGVTITGGSTNPAPVINTTPAPVPPPPAPTNSIPGTNTPAITNPPGGPVNNPTYQ